MVNKSGATPGSRKTKALASKVDRLQKSVRSLRDRIKMLEKENLGPRGDRR